jgi:hypothetical protein
MSLDLNSISSSQGSGDSVKKAALKQQFDTEKTSALSAAKGNSSLLSQINAVSPHKGAMQELEALMLQAVNGASNTQNRTIGIG